MKSVRLQLLVTLLAIMTALGLFVAKGLPPSRPWDRVVQSDDLAQMRRHLFWGCDPDTNIFYGTRALHYAAGNGSAESVKLLLDARANVHIEDEDFFTPLHAAVYTRALNPTVVRMLLAAGADPAAEALGVSPLHLLLRGTFPWHTSAVPWESKVGEEDIETVVRLLIERGAPVNAQCFSGTTYGGRAEVETPLLLALISGHSAIARLLVESGADVNAGWKWPGSPLQAAEESGDWKMVELLRRHGGTE